MPDALSHYPANTTDAAIHGRVCLLILGGSAALTDPRVLVARPAPGGNGTQPEPSRPPRF